MGRDRVQAVTGRILLDERDPLNSYGFTYNDAGRLAAASLNGSGVATYLHNALEQRVSKVAGATTTHFVFDAAGHLLMEADGTGAVSKEYLWLDDLPVALVDHGGSSPALYFIHADHLMTPQKMTDGSRALVWDAQFQPFGEAHLVSGSADMPLRFPGQIYDPETRLHQNWHRDYDPSIGRYIESDPIGLAGGINVYAYAEGNPVRWRDPFGLDAIEIAYDYYPVNTGLGFRLPLGHSAVISVDPSTGSTRYYEFGRYTDKVCGNVVRQWVPDLKMGTDGFPTQKSLENLYAYISKNYGHSSNVTPTYFPDSDYKATIDYAERFRKDHPCYSLIGNNCKTFARDAAVACNEGQKCE